MKLSPINNLPLKVIAVVFAVFLWFYAGAAQDPLSSREFEVPITYLNLADALSLTNQTQGVTVTVKGRGSTISGLKTENFTAEIDLAGVALGATELPVKVSVPKGADYFTVSPNKVKVDVDQLSEKNVAVKASVTGTVAQGYSSLTPSIKPTTVQIKGPSSLLATIATAQVEVNVAGAEANLTLNLPIKLLDKNNEVVSSTALTLWPLTVEVFLPVDQDTPSSKVVPIKPILTGDLAPGFVISRAVAEPETITITGTLETLSKVDQLQTESIMITDLAQNLVQEVGLKVPSGVTVSSNKVKVSVSVTASNVTSEVEIPIQVRNQKSGWEITPSQATAKISVEGKAGEVTSQEKIALLIPYVDLAGLAPGTHEVAVNIDNTSGLGIVQIQPGTISVTISEKMPTSEVTTALPKT